MPYFPKGTPHDTTFPFAHGGANPNALGHSADFSLCNKMLSEKWKRLYPIIDYEMMKHEPTAVAGTTDDQISGVVGGTMVDDLWGEDVIVGANGWIQLHSEVESPLPDAVDTRIFESPIPYNCHVKFEPSEQELFHWGIDYKKDLLCHVPLIILDEFDILVKVGDRFQWGLETYEVLLVKYSGYWKHTNVPIYVNFACDQYTHGA